MPRRYGKLTDAQRDLILQLLAEYRGPAFICRAFQKQYGRSISKNLVHHYNISEKYRDQIALYRERLRATILQQIPLASKFYRLKELDRLFHSENHYRIVRYAKGVTSRGRETQVPIYEKPIAELRAIAQLVAQEMGDLKEVHEVVDRSKDEYVAHFEDGEPITFAETPEAADVPEESVN